MKRFLLVVAGFALPVLLVLGVFSWVYHASGEQVSVQAVVARMAAGEDILYGTAYRYNAGYLKHQMASEVGADFLVLGSSRCMQFRREYFTAESFYNAGGGSAYSNEYNLTNITITLAGPKCALIATGWVFGNTCPTGQGM